MKLATGIFLLLALVYAVIGALLADVLGYNALLCGAAVFAVAYVFLLWLWSLCCAAARRLRAR